MPQVGLDLNSDGTELFITNPDTDSLFILSTLTNQLVPDGSGQPLQIPVGVDPFDVEILQVKNSAGQDVDRAYVPTHGDDMMYIIDVVNRQAAIPEPRNLEEDFVEDDLDLNSLPLTDPRIETLAGSEATDRLFLVSPSRQRVLHYLLLGPAGSGINGDNPSPQGNFVVGPSPRRVALQK